MQRNPSSISRRNFVAAAGAALVAGAAGAGQAQDLPALRNLSRPSRVMLMSSHDTAARAVIFGVASPDHPAFVGVIGSLASKLKRHASNS